MASGVAHNPSNGSLPIKRKPEEEVQFVSSKPVKKCRGSKDPPAEAHRGVDPCDNSRLGPPPADIRPVNNPSRAGPSLPTTQPLHQLSNFNRGASLPSMENFVFPPPLDGISSQTSRSSPMLSPKQLPQAAPSGQADNHMNPSIPSSANDAETPAWCNVSWTASGMPPSSRPMNIQITPNQPTMAPYIQPSILEPSAAIRDERQQSMTPEKSTALAQCPEPATQSRKELGAEHAQSSHQHHPEESHRLIQATQPSRVQKAWQPAQLTQQTPPGPMYHIQPPAQRHASNSNGYGPTTVHPLPPRPPCLACEQTRQHALHNKTNGYPVVFGTSSHGNRGWHSPEVAHMAPAAHMQPPPFPAAGFGVSPSVAQNHLHRPQHLCLGQSPIGYSLTHVSSQGPYPTPMQRAFPGPDMSTSEPCPGVSSHKFNTNLQVDMSPGSSIMSQTERDQHTQAQGVSCQPLAAQPSSATTASPAPAAAPVPPTPSPSPQEKHSPNLIVDIAETCEALFPWDEVAERHNVPRQKVVDTFAAIIQLPLIRCTTDKKRHGRLATNRLKDYTRGKNAMSMASSASPATPKASTNKSDSDEIHDNRPVLPGVVELASSMAPVAFPPTLTQKYPGMW